MTASRLCLRANRPLALVVGLLLAIPAFAQQDFGQPTPSQPNAAPQQPPYNAPPPNQPYDTNAPQGQPFPNAPPSASGQPDGVGGYGASGQSPAGRATGELQDFGVPPQSQLHAGAMHGPTPTRIPGGQVITTQQLAAMMQQGQGQPDSALLFHVLGSPPMIPGAIQAAPASAPGSFSDQTQQEFGQFLQQTTQGNRARPLVFYCQSTQCWMSYNAALRAINMGFTRVLWYRGGIEAWQQSGQSMPAVAGGYGQ